MSQSLKRFNKKFKRSSTEEVEIFDDSNYDQQLEDLQHLVRTYKNVRPFYSVDPRQEYKGGQNILEQIEYRILHEEARFIGVKLYAPVGYSPTDPILMGEGNGDCVYKFCIENKIPVTVHCSNSGFACLSKELIVRGHINWDKKIKTVDDEKIKFRRNFLGLKTNEANP